LYYFNIVDLLTSKIYKLKKLTEIKKKNITIVAERGERERERGRERI